MGKNRFRFRSWPLAAKFTVILALLAIVPLTALTTYEAITARQDLLRTTQIQNLQRARATAAMLDYHLEEVLADIRLVADTPEIKKYLLNPKNQMIRETALQFLNRTHDILGGLDALYLADPGGTIRVATATDLIGRTCIAAPFFRQALAGRVSLDDPTYDTIDCQFYLHGSAPVRDRAGVILGAAISRVTLSRFDDIISPDTDFAGRREFGVLWDDTGIRLSQPTATALRFKPLFPLAFPLRDVWVDEKRFGPATAGLLEAAGPFPELEERSRFLLHDPAADPHVRLTSGPTLLHAAVAPLKNKRWLYGVFTTEKDALAGLSMRIRRSLLVAFSACLLAVLIAVIIAQAISRPIHRMADTAKAVAAGDYNPRPKTKRTDELGRLSTALEIMTDTLANKETTLRNYAVQLEDLVQERTHKLRVSEQEIKNSYLKLQRTFDKTTSALAAALEKRDPFTSGHQRRVAQLACTIAAELGCSEDEIEGLRIAGLLHDIGKINIPSEILSKPGKLSEGEFDMIKTHAQASYDILKMIEFPRPVAQIVLQHHERMDGSGYPQGLAGDQILLEARILGVADVVEAIASNRPYRAALGMEKALEEISRGKGTLFDGAVVEACLRIISEMGFSFEETRSFG